MVLFFSFLASFVVTLALTPVAARLARRLGRVSTPREDRWHRTPTPLFGGLAMAAGVAVAIAPSVGSSDIAVLAVGALAAFALGLIDDVRGMSPATKLVGQVLIGTALYFLDAGVRIVPFPPAAYLLTVVWVVAVMNAVNLLDNMDGLAAGVAVIAGAALAIGAGPGLPAAELMSLAATGAALGFLVHNFPPARVFMGDSGSQLLGYLLAVAALRHTVGSASGVSLAIVGPLLILAVPLFDAAFVAATRALVGLPIHYGGRDHTSHRLSSLGLSERRTVITLYAVAAFLAALGLLTAVVSPLVAPLLTLGIVGLVLFGVFVSQIPAHQKRENALAPRLDAKMVAYARFGLEVFLDLVLLTTAYYTAYAIRFEGFQYNEWSQPFIVSLPIVVSAQLLSFVLTGTYRTLWRFVGIRDLVAIARTTLFAAGASVAIVLVLAPVQGASRAVFIIDWILATAFIVGARLFLVWLYEWSAGRDRSDQRRALIVGAADNGQVAVRYLRHLTPVSYRALGFVDNDRGKHARRLGGLPVLGSIADLETIVEEKDIDTVVIAVSDRSEAEHVREVCRRLGIECREFALA